MESWGKMYPSIIKSQIEEVVYRWEISQLESLKKTKCLNTFAGLLYDSKDQDVIDYLILSKKCEKACAARASKWYYPYKNDPEITTLCSVITASERYNSDRLRDRYTLQAVRAMFSLGRYEDILSLWRESQKRIPEGVIRDMITGYVAGSAYRLGNRDKAIDYYLSVGDLESVKYCAKKEGVKPQMLQSYLVSLYAENLPDSPEIPRLLQNIFYGFEDKFVSRNSPELVEEAGKYYEICMRAVKKSKAPAVWYYTAAYLQDLLGSPGQASGLLAKAENTSKDIFLGESIKVFRMYLDAKLSTYDTSYETKLFDQLKWLDGKIVSSVNAEVKNITSEEPYMMFCGFSYYYWNDMLRKILIGEVCPRMEKAGNPVLALRLLNMADNRLVNYVDERQVSYCYMENGEIKSYQKTESMTQYRNDIKTPNDHDYSNYFFRRLDDIAVQSVISYLNSVGNPRTDLDKFLDDRSYIDVDYLKELIGTRYLRVCKYDQAVFWLSEVSGNYQAKTNVKWYMTRDPFVLEAPKGYSDEEHYKLAFAKEMCKLQKEAHSSDPDIRGMALVRMGTGLRSSFTNCWALTQYHRFEGDDWMKSAETIAYINEADKMIDEGLNTIQDQELAASAYLSQYLYLSVSRKYPHTKVCRKMKAECDKLYDHKRRALGKE